MQAQWHIYIATTVSGFLLIVGKIFTHSRLKTPFSLGFLIIFFVGTNPRNEKKHYVIKISPFSNVLKNFTCNFVIYLHIQKY